MAANKPLTTYLNDHLAGSVAGRDLARKLAADGAGGPHGEVLSQLAADVESDRMALEEIMDRLGVAKDVFKQAGTWSVEKLARLRFLPGLTGSSLLSQLLELEALSMGVSGKRSLWQSLRELAPAQPRLADFDLETLVKRAEDQLDRIEQIRIASAAAALAPTQD